MIRKLATSGFPDPELPIRFFDLGNLFAGGAARNRRFQKTVYKIKAEISRSPWTEFLTVIDARRQQRRVRAAFPCCG
jgi:hypothetical protein